MERDGDEVRLGERDGEVSRFGRVYERQKKKTLTRSRAEEQVVAEEAQGVGGGGAADSDSSLDVDFVPSTNEDSVDDSFGLRTERSYSDNLLCEEDNDIDEEEVRLPTYNRNANASAVDSSRCMGYSFTVDSDYEESDQLREMADDSEDDADSAIQFNQSTDIDDPKFAVGMVFESFEVLKHAIRNYSIKRRYPVTIKWNDKLRVRAVCGDGCTWLLHAAPYKVGRGGVQIKTLFDEHNCVRGFTNKFATSRWIAEAYYEVIRMNPEIKTGQLMNYVQRDYNLHVKRHKVGKARRIALALLRGDEKEQYAKLADYAAELRSTNQNSTTILSLDNLVFKKIFICLTPCKLGFAAGCRPVISLDGCFLKGLYGGQILAAVAIDPNDCIWPIAYAVVDVECRESWSWFLQLLGEELGNENSRAWTFMSDRQKGLIQAVQDLFPESEHRYCVRHLIQNFRKSFTGEVLKNCVWAAAKSTYEGEFLKHMEKLKELSLDAWVWMNNIPRQQWSRAFFREHSKCDITLNNLSECFNNFILDARDKPILTCLELIRTKLMVRVANKREIMERWNGRLCPKIVKKLDISKAKASSCWVLPAGLMEYQVDAREGQYAVNLGAKTCSCRKWQLTGLPCAHACAALARNGNPVESVADSAYTVETYKNVYANIIHPVRSMDQWKNTMHDTIVPPEVAPPRPGRPKKKRRRGVGEEPASGSQGRMRRLGLVMHCKTCGGAGHNKRKCPTPGGTSAAQGSTSGPPAPTRTTE